jgi:sporulation protein YlmC with PRC-barrel domain
MFLFRDVMDKGLVDCHGHKAGKVDDIVLDLREGEPPAVRAIVTGRGAAAPIFPQWIMRLAGWIEGNLLGHATGDPVVVGWEHVTKIDVAVHLDLDRRTGRLTETEQAIWQRWIKSLPWAER